MTVTHTTTRPLWLRCLLALWIACLLALLAGYQYLLLQWPMLREAHFLHYIGYLINEHHFVPYRDILETSWFGTFLFHMGIGKIFGYTSLDFRIADLSWLVILSVITWRVMRKLDDWLAWIASLSAALAYIHFGPANTLQRDYVLLLPIMLALLISVETFSTIAIRTVLIGACFGAAASIKPHAVIGLPIILTVAHSQSTRVTSWLSLLPLTILGFVLSFGAGLCWLWYRGGLANFVDMTLHYLPLYQAFNGAHQLTTSAERWQNTIFWWKYFLWTWPYTIAGAVTYALWNTNKHSRQRTLALALAALALCYNIYPLIAGKFWDYHWIPYTYFSVLAASCLLIPPKESSPIRLVFSCVATVGFCYTMLSQYLPNAAFAEQIRRYPASMFNQEAEDNVVRFIQQHLRPDEKIQIIEQGGPSTLYLLRAKAVLATPYIGSFMFLHDIETPYVKHAQKNFLSLLQKSPPKLFLVMTDFTKPSGLGTIKDIPNLNTFLQEHYEKIWETPSFTFWQYRISPISQESQTAHPITPDSAALFLP